MSPRGEGLDGLAGLLASLGKSAEADCSRRWLGQEQPFIGELKKIPRGRLMDGVVRLAILKVHGDATGFFFGVDLDGAGVDGQRFKAVKRSAGPDRPRSSMRLSSAALDCRDGQP